MRHWEIPAERDYRRLRNSRPPFVTEYEKDLLLWQRRDRMIVAALALLAASVVGFTIGIGIL